MQFGQLKRRDFITLLGGAAAWPVTARAQPERMRRIGVLITTEQNDRENQAQLEVFRQALRELGWREGGNVRIDIRSAAGNVDDARKNAAELVALAPAGRGLG